ELKLPKRFADEMIRHCEKGRPNEACGMIASAGEKIVAHFPMANVSASPVRYGLDPREQFAVYKTLDQNGWELAGVYHSHTRTEAYPSPTYVRLASEDVPYLIVSLASTSASIRAFRIVKDNWTDTDGEITEIPVVVTP
ncbi:MAG: Mov34/MPN/PAD-1 family protein, partial [Actinomycetota bacterium]